ncbi:MAG: hypothetical protein ACJZ49_00880 [Candidatus Thalassarchaeaceae archaeon]|tara:strand:- start:4633 stop:7818 length:3186 start_codon:yes stop_codon:yes gene_type:complete
MFELPHGDAIDQGFDGSAMNEIMDFECGVVSTYKPKSRAPCAHRIIAGGRVVGWITEAEEKRHYVGGQAGKARLVELEDAHELKHRAYSLVLEEVRRLIDGIPESLADSALLGTLGLAGRRLPASTNEWPLIVDALAEETGVISALAFEDGILIHSSGSPPGEPDALSADLDAQLKGMDALTQLMGASPAPWYRQAFDDHEMTVARDGGAGLAIWTTGGADPMTLLMNAASTMIEPKIDPDAEIKPPSDGFVVREGKGGVDALISMLSTSKMQDITGHIRTEGKKEPVYLLLIDGIPTGLIGTQEREFEQIIKDLSSPSADLQLHRLERAARLTLGNGNVSGFTLATLSHSIATVRTRSESRKTLLTERLDRLYRFEMGMESIETAKSQWKLLDTGGLPMSKILPTSRGGRVLQPEDRQILDRINRLEEDKIGLERERGRLERLLEEEQLQKNKAENTATAKSALLDDANERAREMSNQLDQAMLAKEKSGKDAESDKNRADALSKRVAELEHQVERKASEIASAIGESKKRAELQEELEELMKKEAEVKSTLENSEARLDQVRTALSEDERVQRVLGEQVGSLRERHRHAEAETKEAETRMRNHRVEVAALEGDLHTIRRQIDEDRGRVNDLERRQNLLQTELKELMTERRTLMRELGDLDARKAHSEGELREILTDAEELTDAHEQALVDIAEAERIRARLQEEPLARALLDEDGLKALEPVLERMENARSRGLSMVLLDRAVERGLAVIQHTVDEVAATPRYLLSSEVVELLEQQAPETASAVRGLTRWSVQQRLHHMLGQIVTDVVIDLEEIIRGYEEAATVIGQMQDVLRSLNDLGMPVSRIESIERMMNRPEALPRIASETQSLIRSALDDIYIDADMRDAGSSVDIASTIEALERMSKRLDVMSGDEGSFNGPIWKFQNVGMLPFETGRLSGVQRPEVDTRALEEMDPERKDDENNTIESNQGNNKNTWERLEEPSDTHGVSISDRSDLGLVPTSAIIGSEEIQQMRETEEQVRAIDNMKRQRDSTMNGISMPSNPSERDALSSLEEDLSDLDI